MAWATVDQPPVNDAYSGAEIMIGDRGSLLGSNINATAETMEPFHHSSNTARRSVWYQWTPSASGTAVIDTNGSFFDTVLAIYTGDTLGSLQILASNDDDVLPYNASRVRIAVESGVTYRLAVDGNISSSFGSLMLNWRILSPPQITQQPVDAIASVGGTATFNVMAGSLSDLSYQWIHNGVPVAEGTEAGLEIATVEIADAGSYQVAITNEDGSVVSDQVQLRGANALPVIQTHPTSVTVGTGDSASFSVAANGSGPLLYQWRANGNPIAGAVGATLNLPSVSLVDKARIDVVIWHGLSSVISQPADLNVTPQDFPGLISGNTESVLVLEIDDVSIRAFAAAPEGGFYVAGWFSSADGDKNMGIVRLLADGSVDPTFDTSWFPSQYNPSVETLVLQADGKIVVGGNFSTPEGGYGIARLNPDGSQDLSFQTRRFNSSVVKIVPLRDDRLAVLGWFSSQTARSGTTTDRRYVAVLEGDGSLDLDFTPPNDFNDRIYDVLEYSDGSLLLGGAFSTVGGSAHIGLVKLNAGGSIDEEFASDGGLPNDSVWRAVFS
ncbi:MAG: immunoglobulin domain-containing protein, partial [Rhodanobacter sp.]